MAKISLEGGSRWFDDEKATQHKEHKDSDGNNMISRVTGSQWEHEALYRTASGTWVLHHWSGIQGVQATYEIVADATAHAWLVKNGEAEAVPADDLAAMEV